MKKLTLFGLVLALMLFFTACGSGGGHYMGESADGDPGASSGDSSQIQAGTLTAGEWNDNKNYDFFLSLFEPAETPETPPEPEDRPPVTEEEEETTVPQDGIFYPYRGTWGLDPLGRFSVDVRTESGPCPGAQVTLLKNGEPAAAAVADARGRAYLFPREPDPGAAYSVRASSGGSVAVRPVTYGETAELVLEPSAAPAAIDLCFVVDTTGSMGDELEYLKKEIDSVIRSVKASNEDTLIRLAFVFYRDEGDAYVTRTFDFSENISGQCRQLSRQRADGGGDYPEAVHTALADALALSWSGDACKLMFFVLDAPPHDTQEIRTAYGGLVYAACERGIRIVPVLASGADALTQYLMRSAAVITNGTFVFLTDDSGVGLPHERPAVGPVTVEYLNACLVRVINELYTGVETPPVPISQQE